MRGRTRVRGRRGITAIIAAALLLGGAVPVNAAWSSSVVDPSYFLTRPSLRVDSADHTGIAYGRTGGSPGIFYATNATGGWVAGRATSGADAFPSLRFDGSDKAHVAFARLAGAPGVYVTDNSTGSWSAPTLVAADRDPTLPALAIDGAGHQSIAWTSNYSFAPGLYFATNSTGSWVKTRVTSGTWENAAALQLDGAGHAHVLFARYAPGTQGIYYATNRTGSWVVTRLTSSYDDSPAFVFDGSAHIQAAFSRFGGTPAVFALTNATGSWVATQLPSFGTGYYGSPTIAIQPAGSPHIFVPFFMDLSSMNEDLFQAGSNGHVVHYVRTNGTWDSSSDAPSDDPLRNDAFPSLGFLSNGTIQLAFRRLYPSGGLRLYTSGTGSTLLAASHLDDAPAIALGPSNARDISFNRAAVDGQTIFATGTGAGWTLDTAGTGYQALVATDIAADTGGGVRIVDGGRYYSGTVSSWTSDTTVGGDWVESAVGVDGAGHAAIFSASGDGFNWGLDYRSNATGSWVSDPPPINLLGGNPMPTLALDAAGKARIAYVDGFGLVYQHHVNASWSSPAYVGGQEGRWAWPSIAVDAAGKVHIAYLQFNLGGTVTGDGVYYVTNKSGSWVVTRLTRSFSDGKPSIAVDAQGHVFIATTRASWAADPGVYVMTNVTGAWVKARVVATTAAGDVSLAVTSGGLARMVFSTSTGILEYENSTTTLTVSAQELGSVVRSQVVLAAEGEKVGTGATPVAGPPYPHDGQPSKAADSRTRTAPGQSH